MDKKKIISEMLQPAVRQYKPNNGEDEYLVALDYDKVLKILMALPVCGKEQRKFLNEIEKLEPLNMVTDEIYLCTPKDKNGDQVVLLDDQYFKSDFLKVVQGE